MEHVWCHLWIMSQPSCSGLLCPLGSTDSSSDVCSRRLASEQGQARSCAAGRLGRWDSLRDLLGGHGHGSQLCSVGAGSLGTGLSHSIQTQQEGGQSTASCIGGREPYDDHARIRDCPEQQSAGMARRAVSKPHLCMACRLPHL